MSKFVRSLPIIAVLLGCSRSEAADDKRDANDPLTVALGAATGAFFFESHDKIGVCEIAGAKGADLTELQKKLDITLRLLKGIDGMLDAVHKDKKTDENDKKFITEATAVSDLIKKEAEALKAFLNSKDDKDGEKYREARKEAEGRLKALLGIKK
jgi:molecular chaperone DnaK (HSP70)